MEKREFPTFLVVGTVGREARSGRRVARVGDALGENLTLDVHLRGHGDPVGVRQHGLLRPEGIRGALVRRAREGRAGSAFRVKQTPGAEIYG